MKTFKGMNAKLEAVSKIKGWIVLVNLCFCLLFPLVMDRERPSSAAIAVLGFAGWSAILFGISWIRGRRRIRELGESPQPGNFHVRQNRVT